MIGLGVTSPTQTAIPLAWPLQTLHMASVLKLVQIIAPNLATGRRTLTSQLIPFNPGLFQRHIRISAQRQRLCLTVEAKGKSPPLTAGRRDDQIETPLVIRSILLVAMMRVSERCRMP
jgi:hypothetical protein